MAKKAAAKAAQKPKVIEGRMVGNDAKFVRVQAIVNLNEDGHRNPGDEFDTTEERAAALGDLVKVLGPAESLQEESGDPAGDQGGEA